MSFMDNVMRALRHTLAIASTGCVNLNKILSPQRTAVTHFFKGNNFVIVFLKEINEIVYIT